MEKDILLINLYGPNRDEPVFYEKLYEMIKGYRTNNIIIVGDFNLTLEQEIDCYN